MLHVRLVTVMLSCVLPSTAVAVVVIVFTLLRGSSHPVTPTPTRVAQPSVLLPRTLVSYLCARV